MPSLTSRKPASALLLIVLIMGVASTLTLAAARVLLSSTRLANRLANADLAERMAWSALEEGSLRGLHKAPSSAYRVLLASGTNPLGTVSGEYGDGATANPTAGSAYSLRPMRRGYAPGSDCQTLLPDQPADAAPIDSDCPYYDLAVRRMVSLQSSPSASPVGGFGYGSRELPQGIPVSLDIWSYAPFRLEPDSGFAGQIDYSLQDSSGTPLGGCSGTSDGPAVIDLTACSGTAAKLSLTVRLADLPSPTSGKPGLQVVLPNGGTLVIDKGYTTIEAIGYSGGVQKRLQESIRLHDGFLPSPYPPSNNVIESAVASNASGLPF